MSAPLHGIFVLDFSTLLPGPLATLMLTEAGADVIKVERPQAGAEARKSPPLWDGDSLGFSLLNRGKKSLSIDLKAEGSVEKLKPLIEQADIIVEQFRPGVMARLGLGYEAVKAINPDIIYCSITGYGQTGPKANAAGHDINYMGDSGVLSTSYGPPDQPSIPPALIADVGGGTYPAVVNILLALIERDKTGEGSYIDISMSDGAFAFSYWSFAKGAILDEPLVNGGERLTGGTPRYRLFPTSDGRQIAVGAIEQKFWDAFCDIINLDPTLRDDNINPAKTIQAVGDILKTRTAAEWEPIFTKADCCCTIVREMNEVLDDPHYNARGIFDWKIEGNNGATATALPVPISPNFRASREKATRAPELGADNNRLK